MKKLSKHPSMHHENLFYAQFDANSSSFFLNEDESKHAQKVLRLPIGTEILVCNGEGIQCRGTLKEYTPKAKILVTEFFPLQATPQVDLALSMLKGDHVEDPVFHSTQFPLRKIHLLSTDFSLENSKSEHSRLLRRLEQKSLDSLKQAKKSYLTEISGPKPLQTWLMEYPHPLIVLDAEGSTEIALPDGPFCLCIGPEGGFSPQEMESFKLKGAQILSLGPTRYRARTAPMIALGWLSSRLFLS